MTDWKQKLRDVVDAISKVSGHNNYVNSNATIVLRAIKGLQVDGEKKNDGPATA